MKLRNFLIVLFALLIVFAFASCKHEPEVPPTPEEDPWELYPYKDYTPTANQVQVITITEGVETDYYNRDKLKIEWEEPVEAGDVVTLKYRSERTIYQWDIRNGSTKWVYETSKNNFVDPVIGDGGWATLTYTFADVDINGTELLGDTRFGIYFRGNFVEGDVFEIMDVKLNGEPLEIDASNIKSYATLEDGTIDDHIWDIPRNYAVLLATGKPGEVDKNPLIAKVAPGSTAQELYDELEEDGGYIVKLFSDDAKTNPYDLSTKILKDALIIYYERTGVERTVKFDLNGGSSASAIADITVLNGQSVSEPTTIPTKEGLLFAEWCTDKEGTKAYDFSKAVKEDITLYARYATPRTVKFNTNGGSEIADVQVPDGKPVAKPADPTNGPYAIDDWYLGGVVYDFTTPVTSDITIDVVWSTKTTVTLNLDYTGTTTTKTFKTPLYEVLSDTDENLVVEDRIGFFFEGWYDDAAFTAKHDFSVEVDAPVTLYGKLSGDIYKIVADNGDGTSSYDKFILDWTSSETVKAHLDDVISFRFRTTVDFNLFNVRGSNKWVYETGKETLTSYTVEEDGWISVSYKFGAKYYNGTTDVVYGDDGLPFRFDLISRNIRPGDVLEVKGIAINGVEIALEAVGNCASSFTKIDAVDEWTPKTVTFNSNGGSSVDAVTVNYGARVAKPSDPTMEGKMFDGWYADAELETPFKFDTPILTDTTLYAKFLDVWKVTLNLNYGETPGTKDVYVGKGTVQEQPRGVGRAGWFLEGWYDDAGCTTKHDFETPVSEDSTIYAKWVEPTEAYQFTATKSEERFQFRWKGSSVSILSTVKGGDVITLMVKFPEGNSSAEKKYRIKIYDPETDLAEVSFSEVTKDGDWYLITCVVPEGKKGNGLYVYFYENANAAVGDKVIFKALAFNGAAVEVDARAYGTASTSKGAYSKVEADGEVVNVDGTPIAIPE